MTANHEAAETPPNTEIAEDKYAFPMTVGQQGFWYLNQIHPGNPAHSIALRFRLSGPLRPEILERALNEVVRRHEALRTTFVSIDNEIFQLISVEDTLVLGVENLRGSSDHDRQAETLMEEEAARGFNLETGPLFRCRLLRLEEQEHILLLTIHQIVADGWSTGIILREIAALYEAFAGDQSSPLPEPELQFADYSVWESDWLKTPAAASQLNYWKQRLIGSKAILISHDETAIKADVSTGRIESILLPRGLTEKLAGLSHEYGGTLFMTCLACLKLLLHQRTSLQDIAVSTLIAGRMKTELESVVGKFANTLILRTDLSGDPSLLELFGRVRGTVTDALTNQDVPFGLVLDSLPSERQSHGRRFRINLIFQKAFLEPVQAKDLTIAPIRALSPGAMLDLNFFIVEREEGWRVSCEYSSSDYLPETVQRLLEEFRGLLEAAAVDPHRPISALAPAQGASPSPNPVIEDNQPSTPAADQHNTAESNGIPKSGTVNGGFSQSPTLQDGPHAPADLDPYVAPHDEVEAQLATIWEEVLRLERIGVTDDFFDLGGNSLMAARLLMKIESAFGTRLTPDTAFDHPTIERMAESIKKSTRGGGSSKNRLDRKPIRSAQRGTSPVTAADDHSSNRGFEAKGGNLYRYFAVSNDPTARLARYAYRMTRRFSIPAPRFVFRPLLLAFLLVRSIYYILLRVFICEPLFKAYCESYGKNVHTGTYLHWVQGSGAIILGDNVTIDGKCSFTFAARFAERPMLTVGSKTFIGHDCRFVVGKSITIGSKCAIASGTQIFDSSGHLSDPDRRARGESLEAEGVRPVIIHNHVWIGRNATICPGVTVGEGAIVSTGAVVMSDVAPYTVVGSPAGKIGESRIRSAQRPEVTTFYDGEEAATR